MGSSESIKILVVAGEAERRQALVQSCIAVGYAAHSAGGGDEAVALLKVEKFQLLLLAGDAAAAALIARLRLDAKLADVPLIVVGGEDENEKRVRWFGNGATDFLQQPFADQELGHRVENALELYSARQKLREAEFEFAALRATDPVTGLGNFQRLHAVLDYEVGRALRYQRPLSCAMLADDAVDKLMQAPQRTVADQVLTNIAKAIRAEVRNIDRVFRIDVAEFVVVFPETASLGAKVAIDRIMQVIGGDSATGAVHTPELAASLVAIPHPELRRAEDLFRAANIALAAARKTKSKPYQMVEFQTFG